MLSLRAPSSRTAARGRGARPDQTLARPGPRSRRRGRAEPAARESRSAWPPTTPRLDLLERQLESIRAQTHRNWVCIVSDDCSSQGQYAAIERCARRGPAVRRLPRPPRLGFYRNFERALALVPADAQYVAMADQDDAWHPDKLATLISADRRCAARLQRRSRRLARRRADLRDLVEPAAQQPLRPPLAAGGQRRDRRGVAAAARSARVRAAVPAGAVRAFPRPLDRARRARPGRDRVRRPPALRLRTARCRLARARGRQPDALAAGSAIATSASSASVSACGGFTTSSTSAGCFSSPPSWSMRCAASMAPHKRRALERFLDTDESLAAGCWGWALRGARELVGRPQTLGAEWMLFHAFAVAAAAGAQRPRPATGPRCASTRCRRPPLAPAPERPELHASARAIADKIAPLDWARSDDAPARVNLLDPDDRPPALLRRLHRQVQPRPAAGRARPARADRHRRPGRQTLPRGWRRRSSPTAGSTACSTRSSSRSAASPVVSRSAARTASSPPPGGRPTSRAEAVQIARDPSASST